MAGEDFAGGEVADGDVGVVGDGEDAFSGVCFADAEVVHAACASEAHLAGGIQAVVAQAVVLLGAWAGGSCLRGGLVGLAGGAACQSAVGALLVVVALELVELTL